MRWFRGIGFATLLGPERTLCFEPRVKLPEGAQLTVDWYRKAHWL